MAGSVVASALQIDESALTGESTPAAKDAAAGLGAQPGAGGPDEHGVHEHSGDPRQCDHGGDRHRCSHGAWKIAGMLSATAKEQSPLTKELKRLSLWIAAAAGV